MSQNTTYGVGGFIPTEPFGNALEQWDDDTRTYHDYRSGSDESRAYTADENAAADARAAARTEAANETTIRDKATTALGTNTTFLGLTSPTNAQNAAQIKALTRQVNGLIRLTIRRLDGTE